MGNSFFNLPVPPGNGVGAPIDTDAMGGEKTITVQDAFRGAVNIEISCDGGGTWAQVATFVETGKKVLRFAAEKMRVQRTGVPAIDPGLPNIDVSSNDNGALFTTLPVDGSIIDTSLLGNEKTLIVQDLRVGGTINIQVSDDGVRWATCATFKASDIQFRNFTAKFMRAMATSAGAAITSIGAINDAGAADQDERVKVSAADADAGYLDDKLTPGSGVAFTILNPGGDESLEVSVSGADAGNIDTGPPITVRGPINAEGTSLQIARADHDHRLEYEVEDEGVLVSARPRLNFVGDGVAAVDIPGLDKTEVTIPGAPLGDGGAVVKRSVYEDSDAATSGVVFVDGMSGSFVTVPLPGAYWVIWEGECDNQAAISGLEVAISVNSTTVPVPTSERVSQGPAANFRPFVTTVQIPGLNAGDLIRGLFRRVGPTGSVSLHNRHLTIIKVQ